MWKEDSFEERRAARAFIERNCIAIAYDTETTGLNLKTDRITQLAAAKVAISKQGNLRIMERKNWYINPGVSLPPTVVELTGITDELLADKPHENEVVGEIYSYFAGMPVIGYNNRNFDDPLLAGMFTRWGKPDFKPDSLDVCKLVHEIAPYDRSRTIWKNYKLSSVADFVGATAKVKQFHNAEGDVTALCYVTQAMLKMSLKDKPRRTGTLRPKILAIRWKRYSYQSSFIYVYTSMGCFYFDQYKGEWNLPENAKTDIELYDMPAIQAEVLKRLGLLDAKALKKLNQPR